MNQFFKDMAETMEDRQEVSLNIKKIGTDLVVMAVPDAKKKGHAHQLTGTPEEMDQHFMEEFKKPISKQSNFTANQVAVDTDEDEADSPKKSTKKKKVAKSTPKKEEKKERGKPGPKPGSKKKKSDLQEEKKPAAQLSIPEEEAANDTSGPSEEEIIQKEKEEAAARQKEAFNKAWELAKFYMTEKKFEDAVNSFKLALEEMPADTDQITSDLIKVGLSEAELKYNAWKTLNS